MYNRLPNDRYQLTIQGKYFGPGRKRNPKIPVKSRHFWNDFAVAFGGEAMVRLWLEKFDVTLRHRQFSHRDAPKAFFYSFDIGRDKRGYEIGPHTDTMDKWVTTLFYIPRSSAQSQAGTCVVRVPAHGGGRGGEIPTQPLTYLPIHLLRTHPPTYPPTSLRSTHLPTYFVPSYLLPTCLPTYPPTYPPTISHGARLSTRYAPVRSKSGKTDVNGRSRGKLGGDFQVARKVAFVPNAVFAFAACDASWHAVQSYRGSITRDTIQGFVKSQKHSGKGKCGEEQSSR